MDKLLDNTVRGKRSLLWLKITFVLMIVISALGLSVYRVSHGVVDAEAPLTMGLTLLLLGLVLAVFLLCISCCVSGIYLVLWLFRSQQNIRKLQPGSLSPWLAIIFSFLPAVGQFFHFFVFRRLILRTHAELDQNGVAYLPVPVKLLNGFFALSIAATLLSSMDDKNFILGLGVVLGIGAMVCYIKTLAAFILLEEKLFQIQEEKILRKKVDEVLREREMEKAGQEVQTATYVSPSDQEEV